MNVKVAGNDEFVRRGSSERKERIKVIEKDREWFRNGWMRKEGSMC